MTIFSGKGLTPTCRPAGVSFQPLKRRFSFDSMTLCGPVGISLGLACPKTEEVASKRIAAVEPADFMVELRVRLVLYWKSFEKLMKFFIDFGNISTMNKVQLP